jgi:hypothetical protein
MSETWFADDPYPEIRDSLAEELQDLAPEQIEEIMSHLGVEADVVEDFLSDIGRGVSQALPYAARALPGMIQGAASGAALGVPGMAAGAALGGVGAITAPPPARPPAPRPAAPPRPAAVPAAPSITPPAGADGASSAAQLLLLLSNPDVVRALMALALGPAGKETITIANRRVPVSEIAAMVSVLSGAAATAGQGATTMPAGEDWEDEVPAALDAEARARADLVAELLHQEAVAALDSLPSGEAPYEESDEPYYEAVYE